MTHALPFPSASDWCRDQVKKSRKHCLEALGKVFFPNKRNPDMTEQLD